MLPDLLTAVDGRVVLLVAAAGIVWFLDRVGAL